MTSDGGNTEKTEEKLNYRIEFKADAALPHGQSAGGAGTFEILINEKMRYKINYSIEDSAALKDLQNAITETMNPSGIPRVSS